MAIVISIVTGLLTIFWGSFLLLVSLIDANWFFEMSYTNHGIMQYLDRGQKRLFYAVCGCVGIALGIAITTGFLK